MRVNMECASGSVCTTPKCASPSWVNVRVVRFLQHRNVRVLVWSMCKWFNFLALQNRNVRVV